MDSKRLVPLAEVATAFGCSESAVLERLGAGTKAFYSISELAARWGVSRGSVYNKLRSLRCDVLDFAVRGHRGRKVVAAETVRVIEQKMTRRLA